MSTNDQEERVLSHSGILTAAYGGVYVPSLFGREYINPVSDGRESEVINTRASQASTRVSKAVNVQEDTPSFVTYCRYHP